tara:strand:- start:127 stop:525 length:399 start_codon:yes stop_codon:yes gene_type:complete
VWLSILKYLKLVAVWCRQYWRWLVFAIAVLVSYFLGKRDSGALKEQAKLAKEMYEKEKEIIERAHEKELAKREAARQRYSDAVAKIEKKYEEDSLRVSHAKKEDVKKMVRKAKNDPAEIDRILEQELGIKKQ